MAKMTIEQSHSLPLDEVKRRLQELADRLAARYGVNAKWTSERAATLKRTGVSGSIDLQDSKVAVLLDLSFALLPLKGKIEERIRRELTAALA
jgi:putative polyhydroxyalkanoate system protein